MTGYLKLKHFVGPVTDRLPAVPAFFALALSLVASLGGCSSRPESRPVEDDLTSGRISVACATEAKGIVRRQIEEFQTLYPHAQIDVRETTSREAVGELFGGRADLAVITRDLEAEERSAAVRGGLRLEGFRFACDAVAIVVREDNPVQNLALDDLRAIYDGDITDWTSLGGPAGKIVPVIQTPSSDITGYFVQQVMGGSGLRASALYADGDSAVVRAVRSNRLAIGYVSLASVGPGVRSLRLATLKALPYWKPDQQSAYEGHYPLTRFFSYYLRENGPRLAHGVVTFGTSMEGQTLVRSGGLVPTSVPVRFVRRSPMLSTH